MEYSRQANWYILTGINNETKIDFKDKSEAFHYLNETPHEVDNLCLYCNGDLRYTKNFVGIFDEVFQSYLKQPLETDHGVIGKRI